VVFGTMEMSALFFSRSCDVRGMVISHDSRKIMQADDSSELDKIDAEEGTCSHIRDYLSGPYKISISIV
jgi:hypothetical protein